MDPQRSRFGERLDQRGISRRRFLKFCGMMTATLALPAHYTGRVARALLEAQRPPVVWLEFQDCTGDTESFLRAQSPGVDELLLDLLSLDYHETIMAPAGEMTERSLNDTMTRFPGQYICIVEGSIPTVAGGIHCMIRGRTAQSIAQEVCRNALATIAIGTCAWEGGIAAARTQSDRGCGRKGCGARSRDPGESSWVSGERGQLDGNGRSLSYLWQLAGDRRLGTPTLCLR